MDIDMTPFTKDLPKEDKIVLHFNFGGEIAVDITTGEFRFIKNWVTPKKGTGLKGQTKKKIIEDFGEEEEVEEI